jgi:hypothetical protein
MLSGSKGETPNLVSYFDVVIFPARPLYTAPIF